MKNLEQIGLREILKEDCEIISQAFDQQGWNKPISQYQQYLQFQKAGVRDIIIAEWNKEFAGYLTIQWKSDYLPFREKEIPEIVDFNVLQKFQRKGIGNQLMNEAERRIKAVSKYAGLGFGVTKDYGAAQQLYIHRNYKPDGNGLVKNAKSLELGEVVTIDHSLVFYVTKEL